MKYSENIDTNIGWRGAATILLLVAFWPATPVLAKKGGGGKPPGDTPSYHQIDLGCWPEAINDCGEVAGNLLSKAVLVIPVDTNTVPDGVPDIWFEDDDDDGTNDLAVLLDTPSPGSTSYEDSYAEDLNESRQVVGTLFTTTYEERAFLWQDGVMSNLGVLRGGDSSQAHGINESGWVVGESAGHAFLIIPTNRIDGSLQWFIAADDDPDVNTLMFDLGTLGGLRSKANDISDYGEVVGEAETETGERHPFVIDFSSDDQSMVDLGTLGGYIGVASAINAIGQISGVLVRHPEDSAAFLVSPVVSGDTYTWVLDSDDDGMNDLMEDLGTPKGRKEASGAALNDMGQVVGHAWSGTARQGNLRRDAVIWETNGAAKILNELHDGSTDMRWARDINNHGMIVADPGQLLVPLP